MTNLLQIYRGIFQLKKIQKSVNLTERPRVCGLTFWPTLLVVNKMALWVVEFMRSVDISGT